jgi:hypothetical protein
VATEYGAVGTNDSVNPDPCSRNGGGLGHGLLPEHATLLRASAIDLEVARERGYRSVTSKAELRDLGFPISQQLVPSLLIPIHAVDGRVALHQLRPDAPRERDGKPVKYETLAGARMCLDVHPRIRQGLGNPALPLWITEGIRKADAAVSLGLCCIGLLGVFNWRGTNASGGVTALADWEAIALRGRQVNIAFDSDVVRKPTVAAALRRLKSFLESRGAIVSVVYLPEGEAGAKVGLDDFIAGGAQEADLRALASRELRQPEQPEATDPDCPYVETSEGLLLVKRTTKGETVTRLTNFTARISANVLEDDGVTQRLAVDLIVRLGEREKNFRVSANEFASLRWVAEQVGADAIVHAGPYARDHVRVAIQTFSPRLQDRVVYCHTGWRRLPSGWIYLHAAGAIGESGPLQGVEVELPEDLDRFRLPAPPVGPELVRVVRSVLALRSLAPAEVMMPLLSLAFRTAIGGIDFSVHLVGATGVFKTELAALIQQFWGAGLNSRHLPASWLSTANSIEALCFVAKDAVIVVDDFAPRGSSADVQRFHRDADRLLRAQGNRAGRQRMTADGEMRLTRPPRGAVLSTGEDVPQGHSLQARILVIEVGRQTIDQLQLSAAQREAATGSYALALAGFIHWLAPRYDEILAAMPSRLLELRDRAACPGTHRRTPEIVANLYVGWEVFNRFATEIGAITGREGDTLSAEVWGALNRAARAQDSGQAASDSADRFLHLLRAALSSGNCHLAGRDGDPPGNAETLGWHRKRRLGPFGGEHWEPRGPRIGWAEGDDVLLEPGAAFAAIQMLARQQGEPIAVSQRTLHNRISEARLLESTGGRRGAPVRRVLDGQRREVLHMSMHTLFPPGTDQADQNDPAS